MKTVNRITAFLLASLLMLALLLSAGCSASSDTPVPGVSASPSDAVSSSDTVSPSDSAPLAVGISPVEYYGELRVDGSHIISENTGNIAQVTGMSFFWSNWSKKFYTAEYVDKMVDEFGCEVVRTSYGINGCTPYIRSDEEIIKVVVEAAIDRGVYVIIDWHAHEAHKDSTDAVAFFSMMAKEYGEYDNVIFEVYNEPTNVSWADVKSYSEEVIAAIRPHSDNLIIVGSPTWSQDVDKAAASPIDDDNVAYTLHFYAGTHKEWLRSRAERAMSKGIAIFVTEWGSCSADGNGAIDRASTLEWVNWCNKNGISMCNWAVNDKLETSSVFNSDDTLTETGEFIKSLITERTALSEWHTGVPYKYKEQN